MLLKVLYLPKKVMVIEIKKDTPPEEVKKILETLSKETKPKKDLSEFFGKIPDIEDGLAFQKRVRNEWK